MTWTLFWQFVFLIAWTVFCVRVSWPQRRAAGGRINNPTSVRDHTDTVGVRWIGDRR